MAITGEQINETHRICEMVVRHFLQKMPFERLREFFVKSVISESNLVDSKYRLENLVAQTRAQPVTFNAIKLIGAKGKPVKSSACCSNVRSSSSRHCDTLVAPALRTLPRSGCCAICGRFIQSSFRLISHIKRHQLAKKEKIPYRKEKLAGNRERHLFSCPDCDKVFTRRDYVQYHRLTHAADKAQYEAQFAELSTQFECQHCRMVFPTLAKLREHLPRHTAERNFACQVCGLTYTRGYLLSRHHRQKHPELKHRRPLKKAGRKSLQLDLRAHKQGNPPQAIPLLAVNSNRIPCPQCSASFTAKCAMIRHMNCHTGERFVCEVCGASYARHDRLKYHFVRRHPEHEFTTPSTPVSVEIRDEEKQSEKCLRESNLVKLKLHLEKLAAQTPIPNIDAIPLDSSLASPTTAKVGLLSSLGSPVNKGMPPTVRKSGSRRWNYDSSKRGVCVLCGRRFKDATKLRQHQATHGTAAERRKMYFNETSSTTLI